MQITEHHPVLRTFMVYKLKYVSFEYFMNYDHIKYAWVDRGLGTKKYGPQKG